MDYQRKDLATDTPIGPPGPLPAELVGLAAESLADLSWADPALGYEGQGFVAAPADPPPPPPLVVSALGFKQLFTQAERIAIRQAAAQDPAIEDLLDLVNTGGEIRLGLPLTIEAVNQLEAAELIGPGRAVQILSAEPPA